MHPTYNLKEPEDNLQASQAALAAFETLRRAERSLVAAFRKSGTVQDAARATYKKAYAAYIAACASRDELLLARNPMELQH